MTFQAVVKQMRYLLNHWQPVQGVPRLSPEDCWDRLQPPRDPTDGLSGRIWMDGYLLNLHHCFITT